MRFFFVHNKSSPSPLDLTKLNTSNVTNMREMFMNSNISNINLSSFDMSNVSEYEFMFRKSNATVIDLSNIDTTKFSSDNIADLLRDLSNDSITVYVPNQNCIDTLQYMVDSKITLALKKLVKRHSFSLDLYTKSTIMLWYFFVLKKSLKNYDF